MTWECPQKLVFKNRQIWSFSEIEMYISGSAIAYFDTYLKDIILSPAGRWGQKYPFHL